MGDGQPFKKQEKRALAVGVSQRSPPRILAKPMPEQVKGTEANRGL